MSRRLFPFCVSLSLLFPLFSGCETDSSTPVTPATRTAGNLGAPQAVPSADIKKVDAYKDATLLASRGAGRQALVGGGASMNPVYGDNTMLVVHPIEYADLKAGMTVVYLSKSGRRVAHQLIAKESKGWRAQGINNPGEDQELVTPENLIGIVYASMVSEEP